MKKRLAIWLHGGLGTGHFDQGYPLLERLLEGLSASFELVVYSMAKPNEGYHHKAFRMRSAPSSRKATIVRWMTLIGLFIRDHRRQKYDLVMAFWGWPAGVIVVCLGKILRMQSVVYLLGADAARVPSINYGIFNKPLLRQVALWAYHQCTMLLTISQFQKDQLFKFGLRRPVVVIPWGVDPEMYRFSSRNRSDVIHFIHVAHMSPVKDPATMVRAFARISRHHPSELYILGVDNMKGAIADLCRSLKILDHVKFIGMVPYAEMPTYYDWADIMLHTSLSEGQCMALTEAATCGILIAGTPVGLLYDLKDDCGIIADFGDDEGLSAKVIEILGKREEWDRKVENARKWSGQHTLRWTVDELIKHLSTVSRH